MEYTLADAPRDTSGTFTQVSLSPSCPILIVALSHIVWRSELIGSLAAPLLFKSKFLPCGLFWREKVEVLFGSIRATKHLATFLPE